MGYEGSSFKPPVTRRIAQLRFEGLTVFDADPMDGGLSVDSWLRLWSGVHVAGLSGPQLREWPDGRPLMEQPSIAVDMFELIGSASEAVAQRRRMTASGR